MLAKVIIIIVLNLKTQGFVLVFFHNRIFILKFYLLTINPLVFDVCRNAFRSYEMHKENITPQKKIRN